MSFEVLSAAVFQETNTFNVHPTTLRCFEDRFLLRGDPAIGDQNTELAGLLDVGLESSWAVTHAISAAAGPGGRVTRITSDTIVDPLVATAAKRDWNGIFVLLHGSVVTDFCEDGGQWFCNGCARSQVRKCPSLLRLTLMPMSRQTCAIWHQYWCPSPPIPMLMCAPLADTWQRRCSER